MTQPTDVYSVYDASGTTGVGKGNREDLVNIVYDISPTKTPTLSALPRAKAEAVLHEWTTHALAAAAANERVEGDDIAIDAASAKTRLNNRTAISAKVAGVTKTQQAVSKVGMQDALAEEVGYKMAEIKRDMELMIHSNTAKVAGNDTQRALTEGLLQSASQLAYDDGGNPSLLIVGAFNKRVVSGFPGNQTRNVDADEKKLVNSISIYEDDFNTLKVVADRFCVSRNATLIDTEYMKIAYLRPFSQWDLAVIGSSMRKQIEVEWALEVCNPDAHAIIRDLTTS
jgi:hypothetical protein